MMHAHSYELAISNRTRSTPYTRRNEEAGVKAYTVYNNMLLPTRFRGDVEDYWHLCEHVQVWDVSCERQIQVQGPDADRLVQWMTPRDISRAADDQCFYLPLCDENGRIINDPVAIRIDRETWWLSIADSDVELWAKGLALGAGLDARVEERDIWPLAVQGPKSEALMERVFGPEVRSIGFFRYKRLEFKGALWIVARSGWSRQGGFEIYVDDASLGRQLWDALFEAGGDLNVGPGCPSLIERIEGGLLSYGNDMDARHTPFQCGLDRFCNIDRDLPSMSLEALRQEQARGADSRLVGLLGPELEVLPGDTDVYLAGERAGYVTSGSLSARYSAWLGFAMLDSVAIERVKSEKIPGFTVRTLQGEQALRCSELPFDFSALELPLRPRGRS